MSDTEFCSWTIFNRPADFPMGAIARKFVEKEGQPWPTAECIRGWTVDQVRRELLGRFPELVHFPRSPGDSPSIVETWL